MPLPALLLVIATLLPLAAFVLLLAIGRRMGDPLAGWVATALAAGSFALSMAGMIAWYEGGQLAGMTWGPGDKPIELSYLHIDTLTVAMFNTITLVVALGHAFSARYMREDKRFVRFFVYLQLSYFSMLAFVLSVSLLEIFVFWCLIGLSGYLLLTRLDDSQTGPRAVASFIVKRIGDAGFLVGLGILFHFLGNATLLQMDRWLWSAAGAAIQLPGGAWISDKTLTLIGIAIFCGAACRSALFPLHFWLPAAGRAPIPAAAFVQSATLTTAGVYMIARIYPILTPTAKLCIGIVGLLSLLFGAVLALVQSDVGRILAYSTVSQFGLMFMAIGIGSWVGGLFHLLAHAFFKSLLVLAAGSAIHAALGKQNLERVWRPHTEKCTNSPTSTFCHRPSRHGGRAVHLWLLQLSDDPCPCGRSRVDPKSAALLELFRRARHGIGHHCVVHDPLLDAVVLGPTTESRTSFRGPRTNRILVPVIWSSRGEPDRRQPTAGYQAVYRTVRD